MTSRIQCMRPCQSIYVYNLCTDQAKRTPPRCPAWSSSCQPLTRPTRSSETTPINTWRVTVLEAGRRERERETHDWGRERDEWEDDEV